MRSEHTRVDREVEDRKRRAAGSPTRHQRERPARVARAQVFDHDERKAHQRELFAQPTGEPDRHPGEQGCRRARPLQQHRGQQHPRDGEAVLPDGRAVEEERRGESEARTRHQRDTPTERRHQPQCEQSGAGTGAERRGPTQTGGPEQRQERRRERRVGHGKHGDVSPGAFYAERRQRERPPLRIQGGRRVVEARIPEAGLQQPRRHERLVGAVAGPIGIGSGGMNESDAHRRNRNTDAERGPGALDR